MHFNSQPLIDDDELLKMLGIDWEEQPKEKNPSKLKNIEILNKMEELSTNAPFVCPLDRNHHPSSTYGRGPIQANTQKHIPVIFEEEEHEEEEHNQGNVL